jgi:hypothetical protein
MYSKKISKFALCLGMTALLAAMLACGTSTASTPTVSVGQSTPTETVGGTNPTDTAAPVAVDTATSVPIVHTTMPGELPAAFMSEITDRNSSSTAAEKRASGGENYASNLYERPFNANSMDTYYPDLDITRARMYRDDTWIFVTISLVGPNPAGGLLGDYGVELDLNSDGRGDTLLMASKSGAAWSTDGMRVWTDANHDVGSVIPVQPDAPANTDGYETLVFDSGVGTDPDAAWARVSPADPNIIQIAFKRALVNNNGHFLWGAWAMSDSMLNPAWFDYNDHFTVDQAGSPLIEMTQIYPIKSLAQIDNTCRWGFGFVPTGNEPGVCPLPVTPTPTRPGSISGVVYHNKYFLTYPPADNMIPGATIRVRSGSCGSPGGVVTTTTTNGVGFYSVSVSPGTYCVDVSPDAYTTYAVKTSPQTVSVGSGAAVSNVNFGYADAN